MDLYEENAMNELKRAEHLLFVSLKYTRTVDVIRNIIERLINSFDYMMEDLFRHFKNKIKEEIPKAPVKRAELLKTLFKDNEKAIEAIDFYLSLRKVIRAKYVKQMEFRKPVAMVSTLEDIEGNKRIVIVDLETIENYYNLTKRCVEYINELIQEKK